MTIININIMSPNKMRIKSKYVCTCQNYHDLSYTRGLKMCQANIMEKKIQRDLSAYLNLSNDVYLFVVIYIFISVI